MRGHPWYKRYPSDFIQGTIGLTLEQKGAYSICLDLMYEKGGPIVDNCRTIARACGCSLQKWNKIRGELIKAEKLNEADGHLSNGRAVYEMHRSNIYIKSCREAGKKSGEARRKTTPTLEVTEKVEENLEIIVEKSADNSPVFWGNLLKSNEADELVAEHTRDSESRKKEKEEDTSLRSVSRRARRTPENEFAKFYAVYPRKKSPRAAEAAFSRALLRASFDEIMAGLYRYQFSPDPQYQKHPATWLNQNCWEDVPDGPAQPDPSQLTGFAKVAYDIQQEIRADEEAERRSQSQLQLT